MKLLITSGWPRVLSSWMTYDVLSVPIGARAPAGQGQDQHDRDPNRDNDDCSTNDPPPSRSPWFLGLWPWCGPVRLVQRLRVWPVRLRCVLLVGLRMRLFRRLGVWQSLSGAAGGLTGGGRS
jgi:hypothetical protein